MASKITFEQFEDDIVVMTIFEDDKVVDMFGINAENLMKFITNPETEKYEVIFEEDDEE